MAPVTEIDLPSLLTLPSKEELTRQYMWMVSRENGAAHIPPVLTIRASDENVIAPEDWPLLPLNFTEFTPFEVEAV